MNLDNIMIGKEYVIIRTGPTALNSLKIGELVRAEYIAESIVTNEPSFVQVRVSNKDSEYYDCLQVVLPNELAHVEDYARMRRI